LRITLFDDFRSKNIEHLLWDGMRSICGCLVCCLLQNPQLLGG
jgi:hypothetical protein